jgi:hypothetical protein
MRELTPLDTELLRKACLRYLAMHHPAGFNEQSLAAVLQPRGLLDYTPAQDSIRSALHVLRDLGLATEVKSPLGASSYWSATAAGKIEMERDSL